jgi:hypothetical protein
MADSRSVIPVGAVTGVAYFFRTRRIFGNSGDVLSHRRIYIARL